MAPSHSRSRIRHVVSISGGVDSEATALVCRALHQPELIRYVFADTGNEHPTTYEFIDYLEGAFGAAIVRLRADFSEQMARKRAFIMAKWPQDGVSDDVISSALDLLDNPTGIPFLDLCLLKGRFPSRRAQFCTQELKTNLLVDYQLDLAESGFWVWSWQGIRAAESPARRHLPEWQDVGADIGIFRPILRWPKSACFDACAYLGFEVNPLYRQGMRRVGCMPCINAAKDEVAEIARRWPEVIDRIERWESAVKRASKAGAASFFPAPDAGGRGHRQGRNIRDFADWAMTTRGGRQYDLFKAGEALACSSSYGLCE